MVTGLAKHFDAGLTHLPRPEQPDAQHEHGPIREGN